MGTVPNALDRFEVHFPAAHPYSCGASLGKPQSADPAKVTCTACRSEHGLYRPNQVRRAVEALQAFGGDLTREQAEILLGMWAGRPGLDDDLVVIVLAVFPAGR